MLPINVIIWSCVGIFIATAVLTLLHVSGIRPLPNSDHGSILFKALIVEVAVIAVGAFASTLLPSASKLNEGGLPSSIAHSPGVFLNTSQYEDTTSLLPRSSAFSNPELTETEPLSDNCQQITVSDASTFPPSSRIETICQ